MKEPIAVLVKGADGNTYLFAVSPLEGTDLGNLLGDYCEFTLMAHRDVAIMTEAGPVPVPPERCDELILSNMEEIGKVFHECSIAKAGK